jgi:two-component system, NtrC family, sensor histidine kinase HydH
VLLARRLGWVLLVMALFLGAALVSATWSSYSSIQKASGSLINGQAGTIIRSIGFSLRRITREATQPELQEIFERGQDLGLSFLGLFDPLTKTSTEAGVSCLPHEDLWQRTKIESPFQLFSFDACVVVIGRPPPVSGAAQPSATESGAPTLIFEFFPSESKNLQAEARRTLIIGSVATLIFFLTALAFGRLLRYQASMERQNAQEQQLAALGSMSAVLAHEIRNPLTSLKGHSQLLLDSLPHSDANYEKAERIVNDAVRLESLSTNLLDFVRNGQIERQQVDPKSLLYFCAEAVDLERIQLSLAEAPLLCSLDPERIQQTMINLLRNALEASPPGSMVEVRAASSHGSLVITVRDFGPGIPAGQEEKIFTPFHTTRLRGTGLGLAVSRRIIELHGGKISAQNHPAGGAVFTVSLPLGASS